MNPAPSRLQPAFLGGLFIGVLSALPLINIANCCCLWVLGGGVLAAYLMQQNYPYAITAADGALVGLMAGVIGGVIGAIISIPMDAMMAPFARQVMERIAANPDMPPETRDFLESMSTGGITVFRIVLRLFFGVIVGGIFAMLGGLLGVALFKKKDLPPPPPPGTVEILPPA
jgi:hypothetical protein